MLRHPPIKNTLGNVLSSSAFEKNEREYFLSKQQINNMEGLRWKRGNKIFDVVQSMSDYPSISK